MRKSIIVVGGGTAGWITLAYLAATVDADLTIVHSDEVNIIGVGEVIPESLVQEIVCQPAPVCLGQLVRPLRHGISGTEVIQILPVQEVIRSFIPSCWIE